MHWTETIITILIGQLVSTLLQHREKKKQTALLEKIEENQRNLNKPL